MAGIDDKIAALAFTLTSTQPRERIAELIGDAAQIARSTGPKVLLTETEAGGFDGVVKNFVGVVLAEFSVSVEPAPDGAATVSLTINDYVRTQSTVLIFIPVSPWSAPGYRTLRAFSEYLHGNLESDAARV